MQATPKRPVGRPKKQAKTVYRMRQATLNALHNQVDKFADTPINQIAREIGISRWTLQRVLAATRKRRVRPTTIAKIEAWLRLQRTIRPEDSPRLLRYYMNNKYSFDIRSNWRAGWIRDPEIYLPPSYAKKVPPRLESYQDWRDCINGYEYQRAKQRSAAMSVQG